MSAAPLATHAGPTPAPSIITQPVFFLLVFVLLPLAVIFVCIGVAVRRDIFPYGAGLDWRSAIPDSLPTEWAWNADRYISTAIDIAVGALVSTVVVVLPLIAVGWIVVGVFALADEARPRAPVAASRPSRPVPSARIPSARPRPRRVDPDRPVTPPDGNRQKLNAWLAENKPMMEALGIGAGMVLAFFAVVDHL